jgi:hypothetical protein
MNLPRLLSRLLLPAVELLLLTLAVGCASTGVIPTQQAGSEANPPDGVPVRIEVVEDEREFQETAAARLVPSLSGDDQDTARRSRAVGRTNLSNGRPGANVFLEPDRTVESITREAVARALRGAGFRVVEEGAADYGAAIPVNVAIEQLWMMKSPPSASPYTIADLRIRITSTLPGLETGQVVEAQSRVVRGGFTRSMWRQVLELGLDELTEAAQDEFDRVRLALESTPATILAPSGLAMIDRPREPEAHAIDYGRYYVLAIGIDEYEKLPRLKTAVSDARAVASLLESAYGFEAEILSNATRQDVIRALSRYRDKVGPRDNLLIYYAGHGWNDNEAGLGYWLPIDADPDDETNWVSNAKITSILRAMQAKHVMVVSDSCYSGTLTRGIQVGRKGPAHIERLASRRTRLALTSGGNEPVLDGGGGLHSVFANALLRSLRENESVLDATTLHAQIREPIMRDSEQTPQFGPIQRARHEDGDFLFVRVD